MAAFHTLSALEIAAAVSSREASATEVLEDHLAHGRMGSRSIGGQREAERVHALRRPLTVQSAAAAMKDGGRDPGPLAECPSHQRYLRRRTPPPVENRELIAP
jgi:hypothetical protein